MLRSKAAPLTARLLSSFFASDARTPNFFVDGVFLQVCEELNEYLPMQSSVLRVRLQAVHPLGPADKDAYIT